MKGNKINGIIWIVIGVILTYLLVSGINGKRLGRIKFKPWSIIPHVEWNFENGTDSDSSDYEYSDSDYSDGDYSEWTFDADAIDEINIEVVSTSLVCAASGNEDKIKVRISNDVDVRKYYKVGTNGRTLNVSRKSIKVVGIASTINSTAKEVIVTVPEVLFDKIKADNVSGKTEVRNIRARKINIDSVSGKIEAKNIEGKLKINNVSGKIEYSTDKLKNNFEIESVSGKIEMELPQESDFICNYETVSGSVKTDFKKYGKKSGEIVNGSEEYELKVETVSGGIEINSK